MRPLADHAVRRGAAVELRQIVDDLLTDTRLELLTAVEPVCARLLSLADTLEPLPEPTARGDRRLMREINS